MNKNETNAENGLESLTARVRGHVQGVGFRGFVRDRARRLRLSGFVRNEPDGSVLVYAQGDRETLYDLLRELREGPMRSRVSGIETEWAAGRDRDDYFGFEVRY